MPLQPNNGANSIAAQQRCLSNHLNLNNTPDLMIGDGKGGLSVGGIGGPNKTAMTISDEEISINEGITFDYALLNLFDLLLQGKTPENDAKDFLEEIKRLPYVKNDNLKAMAVFNRFRKFVTGKK